MQTITCTYKPATKRRDAHIVARSTRGIETSKNCTDADYHCPAQVARTLRTLLNWPFDMIEGTLDANTTVYVMVPTDSTQKEWIAQ